MGIEVNRSMGFVFHIRLAPREVMAALDCLAAAEVKMNGASLSAACKRGIMIALNSLLATKAIPERDGFEYSAMIEPYSVPNRKTKIVIGHALVVQDAQDQAMDNPPAVIQQATAMARKVAETTPQEARLVRERTAMLIKKDADPLNWEEGDEANLKRVTKQLERIRHATGK